MAINLEKFTQESTAIVPILNNQFQYNRKVYAIKAEDGWYAVKMQGNNASIIQQEYDFEHDAKSCARGYLYNNQIIFQNFDVAQRKWNAEVSANINFNRGQSFTPILVIFWEDKKFYYYKENYSEYKILELKAMFDAEQDDIDNTKGVTPEMRTCYIFHKIQRDQVRALIAAQKREEERKKFMATVPGRIQYTLEQAGATLKNYTIRGKYAEFDWEINGSREFNSRIDLNTFMVVEAGFCMSNDDRRHNITSMVKTAQEWENDGKIYRTRGRFDDDHF